MSLDYFVSSVTNGTVWYEGYNLHLAQNTQLHLHLLLTIQAIQFHINVTQPVFLTCPQMKTDYSNNPFHYTSILEVA